MYTEKKKIRVSTKILSSTTVFFNIDKKEMFFEQTNQHNRMISVVTLKTGLKWRKFRFAIIANR